MPRYASPKIKRLIVIRKVILNRYFTTYIAVFITLILTYYYYIIYIFDLIFE